MPVTEEVRGACEILGLDPLYVANEGRFMCFVPEPSALARSRSSPARPRRSARDHRPRAGLVSGEVMLRGRVGPSGSSTALSGEQLPRIC